MTSELCIVIACLLMGILTVIATLNAQIAIHERFKVEQMIKDLIRMLMEGNNDD